MASVMLVKDNASGSTNNTVAQALTLALNVYATTTGLGWSTAAGGSQSYGFMQDFYGNGTGTEVYNVGSNGAAFGVADNSFITINAALSYFNSQTVRTGGSYTTLPTWVIYGGDTTLANEANNVLGGINNLGDI